MGICKLCEQLYKIINYMFDAQMNQGNDGLIVSSTQTCVTEYPIVPLKQWTMGSLI